MAQREHEDGGSIAAALTAADSGVLLRAPDEVQSPVLQVILERARAGSRPRAREDDHLVCLAIEGGGMRGAVSAGMCVVLEAAGLVCAFDRIYGVSAGALKEKHPRLAQLLRVRDGVYNRQAAELQRRSAMGEHGAQVLQLAVPSIRAWSAGWRATASASPRRCGSVPRRWRQRFSPNRSISVGSRWCITRPRRRIRRRNRRDRPARIHASRRNETIASLSRPDKGRGDHPGCR